MVRQACSTIEALKTNNELFWKQRFRAAFLSFVRVGGSENAGDYNIVTVLERLSAMTPSQHLRPLEPMALASIDQLKLLFLTDVQEAERVSTPEELIGFLESSGAELSEEVMLKVAEKISAFCRNGEPGNKKIGRAHV